MKVGTAFRYSWFRGHPSTYGRLVPTAFRMPYFDENSTDKNSINEWRRVEFWAAERFRQRARAYAPNVPGWDDHFQWLLLMQHHGTPTRLLDWTDSILVALFFAVEELPDEDAELWCLRPDALNTYTNWRVCGPDYVPIRYLAADAFLERDELAELGERLHLDPVPSLPLAVFPPLEFPRMASQASRFTIHPVPTPTTIIEYALRQPKDLFRYRIPAECKPKLSKDLTALGVTAESLFQSLDALSETIREEISHSSYEPSVPPSFE